MDDPDSLRIQYEIAVLQHQQNLVELGFHQVDVIRRRRKRRGRRRFWVRPWIGRRRQFGLYDQLLVELRNEDQASFKNFMRMPPEMFDELLTRVGPGIIKQNTHYREALDPGLKRALTLRHIASGPSITQCPMVGGCPTIPYPCSPQKCARPSSMNTRMR